jgi:hypothetical protein
MGFHMSHKQAKSIFCKKNSYLISSDDKYITSEENIDRVAE